MLVMRWRGLSRFVRHRSSLFYIFPFDLLLYSIRSWKEFGKVLVNCDTGLILRLGTTDPYVFCQIFFEKEYESPILELINPSVVIDLGAYSGYSTYYFSKRFPDAAIIAIEANIDNYLVLERTFSTDSRIKVIHAAIHNSDGINLNILVSQDGLWGSRAVSSDNRDSYDGRMSVQTISLASVLDKFDLLNNSNMFLKIDIEGGELEVFDTSIPVWKYFEVIAIETHERIRPGCTLTFEAIATHYQVRDFRGDVTFLSHPVT
jgi:FkbM family methyltransferase